jgi:CSLREA domain-containing protein
MGLRRKSMARLGWIWRVFDPRRPSAVGTPSGVKCQKKVEVMGFSSARRCRSVDCGTRLNRRVGTRGKLTGLLLAGAVVLGTLVSPAASGAATTFTVNSTLDPGTGTCDATECTLREAIDAANATTGSDTIAFAILGVSPHTIAPISPLPTITDPVAIDAGCSATKQIELNGTNAGSNAFGLTITAGSSTVRGLAINRFNGRGIDMQTGGGNTIGCNFIGTDTTGTSSQPNGLGILASSGSDDNVIGGSSGTTPGGSCTGDCNLVSGNANGTFGQAAVQLQTTGNTAVGNYIGTDVTGTVDLGNTGIGLWLTGPNNTAGGTTPQERNVVSGNDNAGVFVTGQGNTVQGNFIGTNAAGTAAIQNLADGIAIQGSNNLIGGSTGTTPGGTCTGACNLISGNRQTGVIVDFTGSTASGNQMLGNFIGTNASGTSALPNGLGGVMLRDAGNTVGGTTPAERNVISGNGAGGVRVVAHPFTSVINNVVRGNYIGTDPTGLASVPNTGFGVSLEGAKQTTVGGTSAGAGNLISGNAVGGIRLSSSNTGTGISDPVSDSLIGNTIGPDSSGGAGIGNGGAGVYFAASSHDNVLGGTAAGTANVVAFNSGNGVLVEPGAAANGLLGNSISSNGQLGIDLGSDGATANDAGDADTGANNLQNFPVLTGATSSGSSTTVQGTLNSTSSTTFRVEFFSSPSCDSSGFGEGKKFLGSQSVTTNGSGNASFTATVPTGTAPGNVVTSTATNPTNNTSEFSGCTATPIGKLSARGSVLTLQGPTIGFSAVNHCTPALSTQPSIVGTTAGGRIWTKGTVTQSSCTDAPPVSPLGFDTQTGTATGTFGPSAPGGRNGQSGTLHWTYHDNSPDTVQFTLRDSSNTIVYQANQQTPTAYQGSPGGVWTFAP